jgi:hypothetical protein
MRALAAIALALLFVPSASAVESTIYPGVGIGHLKLGMTRAQAERALGKEHIVNARAGEYVELGWNFSSWTVGFKRGRAVQISTAVTRQRTTKGIGPGTAWLKLVHTYPGGSCTHARSLGSSGWPPQVVEYLVTSKGGTQTVYILHPWPPSSFYGPSATTARVSEVYVRRPFRRLPEFAPDWDYRCAEGWQRRALP